MRTETNDKLARRNRQIAQYLFFASFGILILGLFVTNTQMNPESEGDLLPLLLPALILPLAFVATMISVRMTNLWVRQPRPEVVIREGLKGLSNKSVLYNYYHIPARHVLISPQGVFAMVTRFQDGRFSVDGDRWTTHKSALGKLIGIFRFDSIGNPTQEAERAAQHVRELLKPIAPDVPVQPLIVFFDPRADVTVTNPTVPVLYPDLKKRPNLKEYLRDVAREGRPSLTPEQIEAFEEATLPKA